MKGLGWFAVAMTLLLVATPSLAEQARIYSIQNADCGDCGTAVEAAVRKIHGVKKATFDKFKVELNVVASPRVTDRQILDAIARAEKGLTGSVGAGKGSYLPVEKYPRGADVLILTENGSAVGPLEKLRVKGKYTIFDFYANWCGPCRAMDAKLRAAVGARSDIAVRKLNVVRFESPLGKEMGSRLRALPHVVVFSPAGKRTDVVGLDFKKLMTALES